MLKVCDIQEFAERAKNWDEIICYGLSQQLGSFIELFRNTVVLSKCRYVADRDFEKQGKTFQFDGMDFTVISPESIRARNKASVVIIIICRYFEEVMKYFEEDEILKEMDFYCFHYLKVFEKEKQALMKTIPSNIRIYERAVIPKVIHYCWFGLNPLPDNHKRWMESWHKFCPDYEIKEWNENNYDISKNIYMKQAYDNKKWGFVPDYARLDIVYQYGGIYLDTDVELVANIDDLLYQDGFIGFESEAWVNFGMGFGAVKGLSVIKELRDDYEKRKFLRDDGSLDLVASPHIQTEFLIKKGLLANGEYQTVEGLTVYPEKFLGGKSQITRKIDILPYTRAIHHFDGSWLDQSVKSRIKKLEDAVLIFNNN